MKPFDGSRVFLILILDTAKNENKSVIEIAAGMVVSSFVDLAQLHPVIDFGVKKLNSIGSSTDLFSGSRNKDVSVSNLAARVTVSGILHPFHLFELEIVVDCRLVWDQLFAHEHAVWKGLVVTTSKHENTWVLDTNLDHLEIMREVASVFDIFVNKILSFGVEYGDGLRIFLEDEQLFWEFREASSSKRSPAARSLCCIRIRCSKFVCHSLSL